MNLDSPSDSDNSFEPLVLRDASAITHFPREAAAPANMVRTQLYLNRAEHQFVQAEAARRGDTMAGIIRGYIAEKMAVPDTAWADNPLLAPPAADDTYEGREDGSLNHDHYAYGAPKRFEKVRGQWVPVASGQPAELARAGAAKPVRAKRTR
jgi:hypothetical protein